MKLHLNAPLKVLDISVLCEDRQRYHVVTPGFSQLERIPNPFPLHGQSDFLVIKGTKYGFAEIYWRRLCDTHQVTIYW